MALSEESCPADQRVTGSGAGLTGSQPGWLVRHPRPLVEPGICYGRSDIAADRAHAHEVAGMLHEQLPGEVLLWCSPLSRCTAVCESLLAWRPRLNWHIDERLAEMDFGCWEGCAWGTIERAALDRWNANFAHERFGGRESVQELMLRVSLALVDVQGQDRPWVWITHAGVIRAVSLLAQGRHQVADSRDWPSDELPFGSVRRVGRLVPQASRG